MTESNKHIPNLLLLHGFMGTGADWNKIIELLDNRFNCLTPDLTDFIPRFTGNSVNYLRETAVNLIMHLNECNIDKCSIVGYSMGGRLALYLLTHFQDRFKSALIESANPGLKLMHKRVERTWQDDTMAVDLEVCDLEKFIDSWYKQPLFGNIIKHKNYPQLKKRRISLNRSKVVNSLRALGTGRQQHLWDKLPAVEIPIRFIAGKLDTKYSVIMSEAANLCPNGHSAIIPNCGHNIHFENPEIFAEDIIDFC